MELPSFKFQFDDPSNQPDDKAIGLRHDGRPIYPDGSVGPIVKRVYQNFEAVISNEIASAPLGLEGLVLWSGSESRMHGHPIRTGVTDIESLKTAALPEEKHERLLLASEFYETDDYLGSILDLKRDFSCLGFTLAYSMGKREEARMLQMEEDKLEEELIKSLVVEADIEEYLNLVSQEWMLPSVIADLFLRLFITDSFILYWRVAEGTRPDHATLPGVWQILSFDPRDCEWENDQGQDRLWYTIPKHMQKKIRDAHRTDSDQQKRAERIKALLDEGIPQEWLDAVMDGKPTIELKKDEGHNWIIHTNGPEQNGLVNPSMYRIFLFLEARRALRDGDFSTSYMMKHFIQHVTIGESAGATGFNANTRSTWATPKEIETFHEIMRQGVRTSRLVTNHTVKINYVFPPKDMFDDAKYKKPELAILHWSHMLEVMITGGGTTNSSGFLGVKSLSAHITFSRDRVSEAVTKFFRIFRGKKSVTSIPDKYYVTATFDQNALKEPAQVLKELQWFVDVNAMSPETALRETGRDANRVLLEKRRAKISQKKMGLYDQIIIRSSQVSSGNIAPSDSMTSQGGRPPNASTTPNEETRTQPATATG